MQHLFLSALRWYIVVAFVIAGIGTLQLADTSGSIKPVFPGLVCLGAAFVLGTAWKDLRRKIMFITIVLVAALAYAAQYMTSIIFLPDRHGHGAELFLRLGFADAGCRFPGDDAGLPQIRRLSPHAVLSARLSRWQ
jgi:hypothetical protein